MVNRAIRGCSVVTTMRCALLLSLERLTTYCFSVACYRDRLPTISATSLLLFSVSLISSQLISFCSTDLIHPTSHQIISLKLLRLLPSKPLFAILFTSLYLIMPQVQRTRNHSLRTSAMLNNHVNLQATSVSSPVRQRHVETAQKPPKDHRRAILAQIQPTNRVTSNRAPLIEKVASAPRDRHRSNASKALLQKFDGTIEGFISWIDSDL